MPFDDALRSPDTLLRHAAMADAAHAVDLLTRIPATRFLDLVITQGELAVDEERPRPAGIDAVGDLARAAIEIMDLPQDADLDLDDDPLDTPTITGWELVTVPADELTAATVTLEVRPWLLALVAFVDHPRSDGLCERQVVGAAADGRLATARLVVASPLDDAEVVRATVSTSPEDLGADATLAQALLAALRSAARGA
jgi:hypothetical protein